MKNNWSAAIDFFDESGRPGEKKVHVSYDVTRNDVVNEIRAIHSNTLTVDDYVSKLRELVLLEPEQKSLQTALTSVVGLNIEIVTRIEETNGEDEKRKAWSSEARNASKQKMQVFELQIPMLVGDPTRFPVSISPTWAVEGHRIVIQVGTTVHRAIEEAHEFAVERLRDMLQGYKYIVYR